MGMTDMTAREGLGLPNDAATVREPSPGDVTIRDGASPERTSSRGPLEFHGYRMKRQMPSTSTEADIYIVEREGALYVLKLYRYGIEPKDDILLRMKDLSQAHPRQFIRVFDVGFDAGRRRWYEVQEHAQHGTLQAMMDERAAFPDSERDTFFNEVAREVGEALHILHQNDLLHLDVKPSNILLRSAVPLDLVLIDFGISTMLSSDMSKKFTQTRGTPMYQSPESWSGGMGRASDWWGLGMILLEIATRAHPFKGLANNVIAHAIATRPIDIPERLEEGRKELIQGLLTRDPEKRWSWDQVSRWLEGERGIPRSFEEGPEMPGPRGSAVAPARPFTFMGRQCCSLAELADAFVQDEEAWEKGRALLLHGSVRAWLEQNGEFEKGEELDVSLTRAQSPDERMFLFALRYGEGMPLVFGGHPLTAQGLLHVARKALRREPLTDMEQKILEAAADGRLLACMDIALTPERASVQTMGLRSVLARLVGRAPSDMAILLDLFLRPQAYWSPFLDGALGPEDAAAASEGLTVLPVPIERWTQMSEQYILPKDLVEQTRSPQSYGQAVSELDRMAREGLLLSKVGRSLEETEERAALASVPLWSYMEGVYRLQWGYGPGVAPKIHALRLDVQRRMRSAIGLKAAELELLDGYLQILAERRIPLDLEDRKILQGVGLDVLATVKLRLDALATSLGQARSVLARYEGAAAQAESRIAAGRERQRSWRGRPSLWKRIPRWARRSASMIVLAVLAIQALLAWAGEAWSVEGIFAAGQRLWAETLAPAWAWASGEIEAVSDPKTIAIVLCAFLAVATRWRVAWGLLAASVLYKFLA